MPAASGLPVRSDTEHRSDRMQQITAAATDTVRSEYCTNLRVIFVQCAEIAAGTGHFVCLIVS